MFNQSQNQPHLKWEAPEINSSPKGEIWYWSLSVISLILIAISLWLGNLLFALFILISAGSLFFLSQEKHEDFTFQIFKDGIRINEKNHPWASFESFSIFPMEQKELSFLYLHKHQSISFALRIPIKTADIEKIQTFLNNYLTEIEHRESLLDSLSHFLGF